MPEVAVTAEAAAQLIFSPGCQHNLTLFLSKAKRDVLQGTLKSIFQGARFCRDNADESIKIASKAIGWPEPATRRAYELLRPLLSTDARMDLTP